MQRSLFTILRIFATYRPLQFFTILGTVPFSVGFLLGLRWVFYLMVGAERTRVPSLILAAILLLIGVQLWIFGFIADLLSANRKLLEDIQLRARRRDIEEHIRRQKGEG